MYHDFHRYYNQIFLLRWNNIICLSIIILTEKKQEQKFKESYRVTEVRKKRKRYFLQEGGKFE